MLHLDKSYCFRKLILLNTRYCLGKCKADEPCMCVSTQCEPPWYMSDFNQKNHIKNKNLKVKKNCEENGPFDVSEFFFQLY